MPNVIKSVVVPDLCVGCGICVSTCPDNNLEIQINKYGEYSPFLNKQCINECSMCYMVCPFGSGNPNEDELGKSLFGQIPNIQHDSETGYYLTSFVGNVASEGRRICSASGGLATWLLTSLLSKGIIDAAICVSPSNEPETLFKYSINRNINDIESNSGSTYYPVQLSDILSYIKSTPGRYAITALPCFAKGIRLAQIRSKTLRERIVLIIGITCGMMKSKHYTDYLQALSGIRGKISSVYFRGKDKNHLATDYYFSCTNDVGETRKLFWSDNISDIWSYRWFTLNSCDYCDDIFAECADAVFMDAWLPEYSTDWRGTSLVIIRNPQLLELIIDGVEECKITIALIPITKVKQSQECSIFFKRRSLSTRLWLAEKRGVKIPRKRVIAKRDLNIIEVIKTKFLIDVKNKSKEKYIKHNDVNGLDLVAYQKSMRSCRIKVRALKIGTTVSHIPRFVMRKLKVDR